MNIAIRADGGSNIGMGHIIRTLVLAEELKKIGNVFYICKSDEKDFKRSNKYKDGIEKVLNEGFNVKIIDEKNVIKDLKKINADMLITDSYDVDNEYFNMTKKIFPKTVYIDDLNLHSFNIDFLINQNINAKNLNYVINTDSKLLLGCQYAMLRKDFRNCSEKCINKNVKNIMVTLGGGDPYNITEQILNWLVGFDYNIYVIIGPSFEFNNELKRFENDKVKLCYDANMYYFMNKCDLCISACGSTLYELAACGVPTLGLVIASNQEKVADTMNNNGMIVNLGWYNNIDKDRFIKELKGLCCNYEKRLNMSKKTRKLVDGKGVNRIVKELLFN